MLYRIKLFISITMFCGTGSVSRNMVCKVGPVYWWMHGISNERYQRTYEDIKNGDIWWVLKVRESLCTQVTNRVDNILNHIRTRATLPSHEGSCIVCRLS